MAGVSHGILIIYSKTKSLTKSLLFFFFLFLLLSLSSSRCFCHTNSFCKADFRSVFGQGPPNLQRITIFFRTTPVYYELIVPGYGFRCIFVGRDTLRIHGTQRWAHSAVFGPGLTGNLFGILGLWLHKCGPKGPARPPDTPHSRKSLNCQPKELIINRERLRSTAERLSPSLEENGGPPSE